MRVVRPDGAAAAVLSFTGCAFVAAEVEQDWVDAALRPGDLSDVFLPPFLGSLATRLGRPVAAIDALLVAPPSAGPTELSLTPADDLDHPRVRRARRHRDGVLVRACAGGVVTVGRGLAGRWEVAVEVDGEAHGRSLGRALATAARHLVPADRAVWAQIAPGNAASVRAFLAAGYRPVGQEAPLPA